MLLRTRMLVLLLLVATAQGAAGVGPDVWEKIPERPPPGDDMAKLSSDLADLVEMNGYGENVPDNAALSSGYTAPSSVTVYVSLHPPAATDCVDPFAVEVTARDEARHLAVALVRVEDLKGLASLPEVRSVRTVLPPFFAAGSVDTEGDAILRAEDLRDATGYNGTGVKIGVISDGVTHLDDAVLTGDLPPDVNVLSNTLGGDEGTAMLEIVHDIAPGASLYFHDCGGDVISFDEAFQDLADAGCTIICDDIVYLDEPYFDESADAPLGGIRRLAAEGDVLLVSSAGNFGLSHYQEEYLDSGNMFHSHDFGGGSVLLPFRVSATSPAFVVLQWADPWVSSANDYNLYVWDRTGSLVGMSTIVQEGNGTPLEVVSFTNPDPFVSTYYAGITRVRGSPRLLEVYTFYGAVSPDYNTPSDSIFGHPAYPGVVTVGAIDFQDMLRQYSSQGPVTIVYPVPEERAKPDLAATDGVQVTGAGGFPNPFYGTSASAPHVAGIAALLMGQDPALNASGFVDALVSSSMDPGLPGYDPGYGYGRADAIVLRSVITPPLIANFSASPAAGMVPLTVRFTDLSGGTPDTWSWAFGDGNVSSNPDPVHVYEVPGVYTVNLTVMAGTSTNSTGKTGLVTAVAQGPPAANFSAAPLSGPAPLTVNFADASGGFPTSWSWAFGEGNLSTDPDPKHVYALPGTYAVNLTVANPHGNDTLRRPDFVTVEAPLLRANFSANATAGMVPFAVHFADESPGNVTSWSWAFGDGNVSTDPDPVHIYEVPGTYMVNLTVADPYSRDMVSRARFIRAVAQGPPAANFSAAPLSGPAPLAVNFTDTSGGFPTSWSWAFGDGNVSTDPDPQHVYALPGTYAVNLTVANPYGNDTLRRPGLVTVEAPALRANFSANATTGVVPFAVRFADTSAGFPTSWSWEFGDGNLSTDRHPVHVYGVPGTYTVNLTISRGTENATFERFDYVAVTAPLILSSSPVPPDREAGIRDLTFQERSA
ncbi:MAG: PKD domain-containing protein [Methanofollis sp.]|uniref:S8 family peptidase n=1 Tax=Methanofollis sp. TaxID=2052835 RepID=UPI0026024633|nr:PKD domain-containing protein [Methanofollis sp.]MDD4253926.1 PKD domain-containing protein [Methanofollis sp.]